MTSRRNSGFWPALQGSNECPCLPAGPCEAVLTGMAAVLSTENVAASAQRPSGALLPSPSLCYLALSHLPHSLLHRSGLQALSSPLPTLVGILFPSSLRLSLGLPPQTYTCCGIPQWPRLGGLDGSNLQGPTHTPPHPLGQWIPQHHWHLPVDPCT